MNIIQQIIEFVLSIGKRQPSTSCYLVELSGGAWCIWTRQGNVVITKSAAKEIASKLIQLTDPNLHGEITQ